MRGRATHPRGAVHRAALTCVAASVAGACAPGRAAPSSATADDSTGYLVLRGPDTVLVEGLVARGDTVRGAITVGHRVRMRYDGRYPVAGADALLELRMAAPEDPGRGGERTARLAVTGERAEVWFDGGERPREARLTVARGTLPWVAPSVGLLARALAVAAARGEGGPSLVVFPPGAAERARLARRGDSLEVVVDGNTWRLATDAAGRVTGGRNATRGFELRRVPHPAAADLLPRPSRFAPPPGAGRYAPPPNAPYDAVDVRIPAPAGHVLAGTLTVPRGPASGGRPAVLLLTGSSPQDRDMAEGGSPYRPFRQLADTLSRRGLVVLRVDDRGVAASTGDFASSTTAERADDARAALAFLRARPEVDPRRVLVAGLSEGGVIAPMLAADDRALRGIVLMAAPGDSGLAVARYQTAWRVRADPRIRPDRRDSAYHAQMAEWEARTRTDRWTRFFAEHDPLAVARRVRVPVLILHGDADRHVPPEHAERLRDALARAGNRDVTMRRFPGVSHPLLVDPDGTPRGEMYLYSFDVAPEVVGALVDWVVARAR